MTLQELKSIRQQVKLNPLAGLGCYTIEDLENDAILAHYNLVVRHDNIDAEPPLLTNKIDA